MPTARLLARSAGILTLVVSALLLGRLVQVENVEAAALLLPAPILSAALALLRPENRVYLMLGAAVLALGLMPMLFGGYGLFFMPSVVLMLLAASRVPLRRSGRASGDRL